VQRVSQQAIKVGFCRSAPIPATIRRQSVAPEPLAALESACAQGLAVTDATADNSCLQVVPGSHAQPLLPHTREEPGSNGRYLALTDADTSNGEPHAAR
jgi:hypothetical protein